MEGVTSMVNVSPAGGSEPFRLWKPPAEDTHLRASRKRWMVRVLLSVVLVPVLVGASLVGLYGCFGWGPVSARDYVGSWRLEGPDDRVAALTLASDGSLEVSGTPSVIFALGGYSKPDCNNTVDLAGD